LISAGLYTLGIRTLNLFTEASIEEQVNYLIQLSIYFVCSAIVAVIISKIITAHYENRMADLRSELSHKILKANFERAEANKSRFIPVLVEDLINISWFAKTIPDALVATFQVIGVMGYLIFLSWKMTLAFIAMFVVAFLIVFMAFPTIYRTEKEYGGIRNKLFAAIEALGFGLKDLSLNPRHKNWFVKNIVEQASRANAGIVTRLNTIDISLTKSVETLILLSLGVTIYLLRILSDFDNDQFFTFLTIMLFILPSFIRLSTFFKRQKKAQVALEQIEQLDVRFDEIEQYEDKASLPAITKENKTILSLKDVKYTYTESDQNFTVGPFELDIEQNEILLIRGGNGSGKTTLAKVITGLYLPQNGDVYFCGSKLDANNLISYRDQFSAVFTDSYVFSDLGYLDNFDKKYAESLLEDLQLHEKVNLNDFSISNTKLSFGQMGRLSLFRTLLEDKPLILLDEWAANQDPHFKEKFYLEIVPSLKAKGKTVILISHDDHYYHIADRIVKMRMGSIEEITTP